MLTGSFGRSALTCVLSAAFIANAGSDARPRGSNADPPREVALQVSLDRSSFGAKEPVRIWVRLANLGEVPLAVATQVDGAPYDLALELAKDGEPFQGRSYWLRRNGPEQTTTELVPGEGVIGELLILLDYHRGYVFREPGFYRVRMSWCPGERFERINSDELGIEVEASSPEDEEFRSELELIALRRNVGDLPSGADLDSEEGKLALEKEGVLLLARIVREDKPVLVDPENRPEDRKEAELVQQLRDLLDRHPNSSYSGYLARYLGLVDVKTFEHKVSREEADAWKETGAPPVWDASALKSRPDFVQAKRYLEMAAKEDLWPAPAAAFQLGRLQAMAGDAEEVTRWAERLEIIRQQHGGADFAGELRRIDKELHAKRTSRQAEDDQ